MKKYRKILIRLALIALTIYTVCTFVGQQQTLDKYSKNKETIEQEISKQNEYKEELSAQKDNINSMEFIEQTAREKLDMYLPNEEIYIDQGM